MKLSVEFEISVFFMKWWTAKT